MLAPGANRGMLAPAMVAHPSMFESLPTSPMPLDESVIRRSVSFAAAQKGRDYFAKGRVTGLSIEDSGRRLEAAVRGSRAEPYEVTIDIGRRARAEGLCTCPMSFNCKHVAAVLYAVLASYQHGSDVVPARDPLAGPAGAWLKRLTDAAKAPAPPASPERLLYILDVQDKGAGPTLRLSAHLARPKKSGGFGKGRTVALEEMARSGGNYRLQTEDRLIMQLVRPAQPYYPVGLPSDPAMMDLLLRSIVATGRCHWRDAAAQPLSQGEPRRGGFRWSMMTDGRQRLAVAVDGHDVQTLPSAAPWYVDGRSSKVGPISLDHAPTMMAALLNAPTLSPAEAAAMHARHSDELAHLGVPPPAPDVVEEIRTETPVPHLRLLTADLPRLDLYWQSRKQGPGPQIDLAVLNFFYDGVALRFQSAPDEQRHIDGRRVIVRRRDKAFERAAHQRLMTLGFLPASRTPGLKANDGIVLAPQSGSLDWPRFLHRTVPMLRAEGWRIDIEAGFRQQVVEGAGDWQLELSQEGAWWFSLELGIEVAGQRLSLLPHLVRLMRALRGSSVPDTIDGLARDGVIYLRLDDDRHLALPAERVRTILTTLVELNEASSLRADGRLDISLGHASALAELERCLQLRWLGGERLRAMADRLKGFAGLERAAVPDAFGAGLRPYQRDGLDWLQFLAKYELGGILADDMGLGKTVQTLAHVLAEKHAGRLDQPCLVVCPTSVMPNWRAEAARLAPALNVLPLHGLDRSRRFGDIAKADLVLTTYALLPRDEKVLLPVDWHLVVLDESQFVKNPEAKTTKLVCQLKARHRLSLTGTPIENHLGELWSQFAFLMPGLLGDSKCFNRVFRVPIEKHGDADRRRLLIERTKPFVLRRTKAQVATELPPKSEIVQRIDLAGSQRDLYETVRLAMHEKVRAEIAAKGLGRSHIVILDALLKLRQVCCDPRLVKTSAARQVKTSAKLEHLLSVLPDLIEEGRRILLFSQFTSMLDLILPELSARGIPFVELRGDTRDRATPVARFQGGEVPLFLISLKAGGTGLNLTAADAVIHYDPWWNPAVENQATDRTHRIGQDKPVFVFKLIAQGTVEERIVELQQRKAALAAAMLDSEGAGATPLSSEDLEILFRPIE
jgi:superfamily II DNA or RNA helicase